MVFIIAVTPAHAKEPNAAPASYILQVSSNLGCDSLNIELISKAAKKSHYLKYTSSAFAAVDLPAGEYAFGDVTCTNQNETQAFDVLKGTMTPLVFSPGRAYYGGRLIFKKVEDIDPAGTPDVLKNCTREFSRARGEPTNDCQDGIGVDTAAQTARQINVYIPDPSDEDISTVRTALKATKEQLLYMPLKNKG
jgi:hypothetical protein